LPQSLAYKTLSDRLATVSSLQMHLGFCQQHGTYNFTSGKKSGGMLSSGSGSTVVIDYSELLARFEYIQQKHSAFRLAILHQKSQLHTSVPVANSVGSTIGSTGVTAAGGMYGGSSPLTTVDTVVGSP
jgi:hypothetical protein